MGLPHQALEDLRLLFRGLGVFQLNQGRGENAQALSRLLPKDGNQSLLSLFILAAHSHVPRFCGMPPSTCSIQEWCQFMMPLNYPWYCATNDFSF